MGKDGVGVGGYGWRGTGGSGVEDGVPARANDAAKEEEKKERGKDNSNCTPVIRSDLNGSTEYRMKRGTEKGRGRGRWREKV